MTDKGMDRTERCGQVLLEAVAISKGYREGKKTRNVLDEVCLQVAAGEVVAVVGRSGGGKSTLLNILGLLDRADSGTLSINGRDYSTASRTAASVARAQNIGFIFQSMNLIPHLTVLDNVLAGAFPAGRGGPQDVTRLLSRVGLRGYESRRAADLSLGEQQRVAVVRALVKEPPLVLADEPTGSLDEENERLIMDLLRGAAENGCAVVVVTHSAEVAEFADRVLSLTDRLLTGNEF